MRCFIRGVNMLFDINSDIDKYSLVKLVGVGSETFHEASALIPIREDDSLTITDEYIDSISKYSRLLYDSKVIDSYLFFPEYTNTFYVADERMFIPTKSRHSEQFKRLNKLYLKNCMEYLYGFGYGFNSEVDKWFDSNVMTDGVTSGDYFYNRLIENCQICFTYDRIITAFPLVN